MAQSTPQSLMKLDAYLLPVHKRLKDMELSKPIFFQFYPEINEGEHSASYESIGDVIGRSETFSVYKSGSNRTISIKTKFAAVNEKYNEVWVNQQVMRLVALTKPVYERQNIFLKLSNEFYGPPLVIFTAAQHYINIPVVVTSVSYSSTDNTIISAKTGLPYVVDVDISMQTNYPYGYVPGYFNYIHLYNYNNSGEIDGSQLSYNGKAKRILVDDVE